VFPSFAVSRFPAGLGDGAVPVARAILPVMG
jgi:hypothetical protein